MMHTMSHVYSKKVDLYFLAHLKKPFFHFDNNAFDKLTLVVPKNIMAVYVIT
jgi:hypothetical protein